MKPSAANAPHTAPLFERKKSQLRRGPNNRLILPPAVIAKREYNPILVSDEVIFKQREAAIAGHLTIDEHTLSAIEASMDMAGLKTFLESDAGTIEIPLSRDKVALIEIDRVILRGP